MNLTEARKIKEQLIRFEGRKDQEGFPFIWKVMICTAAAEASLIKSCVSKYDYDELIAELKPNADYGVFIIGKTLDATYTIEPFENFNERLELGIETNNGRCDFCEK